MDPRDNMKRYLLWTFILILIILCGSLAMNKANAQECDVVLQDTCYKDGKTTSHS
jgi:hypothetical protein